MTMIPPHAPLAIIAVNERNYDIIKVFVVVLKFEFEKATTHC